MLVADHAATNQLAGSVPFYGATKKKGKPRLPLTHFTKASSNASETVRFGIT
jgi:hypothetical protein